MSNVIYIPFSKGSIDFILELASKGNSFETISEITKLHISVIKSIVKRKEVKKK